MGIPSKGLRAVCNMTGSDQCLALCKYKLLLYPTSIPEHQIRHYWPQEAKVKSVWSCGESYSEVCVTSLHPMVMNDTTCLQRFFCMWPPCNASSIYCFSFWILWSVNSISVNIYYNEIVEQQLLDTHTLQPLFLDTSTSNPAPINISKLTNQVWGVIVSSMFTELINL